MIKYISVLALALTLTGQAAFAQKEKKKKDKAKKETTKGKDNKKTDTGGFVTSPGGLKYKLFAAPVPVGQQARKAKVSEIISLHMDYDNGADSILFSSFNNPTPLLFPVMPPSFKGGIEEGFAMLSPGDSAVFKVNSDSLFTKTFRQPVPDFVKPGSDLTFRVKVYHIMTQEEAEAEQKRLFIEEQMKMDEKAKEQAVKDEQILKDYIKANNLKAERTESGLYYVITKKGTGEKAKAGQTVKVHYTGTTLDGKKFDSSVDRGQPFEFNLGQGQVIKGWDEGIALLNKGAKATLLIPSGMAYGERSPTPAIPANGILKFDVELIDMK